MGIRVPIKATGFNPKKYLAIDTEATGLDVWGEDVPFAVSMADEKGNTWYCEWPVDPFTRRVTPCETDLAFINRYARSVSLEKIFHNSKFDVKMLAKVGVKIKGKIHDTLFMARITDTLELSYGLKYLSKKYLHIASDDEKELQVATISARRMLASYNRQALKDGTPVMVKGEEVQQDYWLCRYFDPDSKVCQKYAEIDAFRTMGLFLFYKDIISKDIYLHNKYCQEMYEIWPIVESMETRGMKVFPDAIKTEASICKQDMAKHYEAMIQIIREHDLRPFADDSEEDFNPSSPPQLMRVLYLPEKDGGLGIVTERRSRKTGKLTTDKDTLRELMYVPFVRELAGYRAAKHTLGLFFDKFDVLMKPDPIELGSYCVHPGLNQCGTKTGRFSCQSPNLQQASEGGKKSLSASYSSTKVFGPRKGYLWLDFDYSQQEGRIFAYLAQVPVMLKALEQGTDLFEAMANQAWGGKDNPRAEKAAIQALELNRSTPTDNEKVIKVWENYNWTHDRTKDPYLIKQICDAWLSKFNYDIVAAEASLGKSASRQRCKHITYAKIFGGGPGSYTHLLYCSLPEAKVFDVEYNASMPEMKMFMKQTEQEARRNGYIINLYGRKLRVDPDFAYRGVSYMIQGSAADQMKSSLVKVNNFLKSTTLDAHIIVTIHDAMKLEIREKHYSTALVKAIKSRMEDTEGRIGVPMPVEASITRQRWGVDSEKINV